MSYKGKVTDEVVKAREDEANSKAMAWNFDMRRLERWGNEHRKFFAKITKNPAYLNPFTPVV